MKTDSRAKIRLKSLKDMCQGMSPYERRRWFAGRDAMAVCDPDQRRAEIKRLDAEYKRLKNSVPSKPWEIAVDQEKRNTLVNGVLCSRYVAVEFPPGGTGERRMVLSKVVNGRFVPPNNIVDEDELDGLDLKWYRERLSELGTDPLGPSSGSGVWLQRIRARFGK